MESSPLKRSLKKGTVGWGSKKGLSPLVSGKSTVIYRLSVHPMKVI